MKFLKKAFKILWWLIIISLVANVINFLSKSIEGYMPKCDEVTASELNSIFEKSLAGKLGFQILQLSETETLHTSEILNECTTQAYTNFGDDVYTLKYNVFKRNNEVFYEIENWNEIIEKSGVLKQLY